MADQEMIQEKIGEALGLEKGAQKLYKIWNQEDC